MKNKWTNLFKSKKTNEGTESNQPVILDGSVIESLANPDDPHIHHNLENLDEQHFVNNHHKQHEVLFSIDHLSFAYNKKRKIIDDLNLEFYQHEFVAILGPNGCGKSTLIKSLVRINLPQCGHIFFNNKLIYAPNVLELESKLLWWKIKHKWFKKPLNEEYDSLMWFKKHKKEYGVYQPKKLGAEISYVPQITNFPENTSIYEFVKMGRFPHTNTLGLSTDPKKEKQIIEDALNMVGIYDIRNEDINSVSGGQRQKALIAMSLAQQTETIILDEPTNHLDIKAQLEIMSLLHRLHHELNKSIILVIHDLNLGLKYASRICLMKDGNVLAYDESKKVIKPELLLEAFGVDTIINFNNDKVQIQEFNLPETETIIELHDQQAWDEHLKKHEAFDQEPTDSNDQ